MKTPPRSAFSLIELLVVIGILGVLVSMLVPAIQRARESANNSICKSNLLQIGIAIHTYYDAYQKFPPATAKLDWQGKTWQLGGGPVVYRGAPYFLAPFMEGKYYMATGEADNGSTITTSVSHATTVKSFQCPSRRSTTRDAKCDYAVPDVMSCQDIAALFIDPNQPDPSAAPGDPPAYLRIIPSLVLPYQDFGGAYTYGSCQLNAIPDGTSNTLLMAHAGLDPAFYNSDAPTTPPSWYAGDPFYYSFFTIKRDGGYNSHGPRFGSYAEIAVSRWGLAFFQEKSGGVKAGGLLTTYYDPVPCSELFTSPHGAMPTLWCDGSVRSIRYTKDPTHEEDGTVGGTFGGTLAYVHVSEEVRLIARMWLTNDGNTGLGDADTGN